MGLGRQWLHRARPGGGRRASASRPLKLRRTAQPARACATLDRAAPTPTSAVMASRRALERYAFALEVERADSPKVQQLGLELVEKVSAAKRPAGSARSAPRT